MCYSGAATINEGITEDTIIVDLASRLSAGGCNNQNYSIPASSNQNFRDF